MSRRPFMQWYPSDWRGDPLVRICSPIARYVWFEMLGLMHEAEPYGHLYIAGQPADLRTVAAVIGVDEVTVKGAVKELKGRGVFSLTDDGVIYSRRMIRDEEKRKRNQNNGKTGGNPALKPGENPKQRTQEKQRLSEWSVNPPDKPAVNPSVNPSVNPIFQSPEAIGGKLVSGKSSEPERPPDRIDRGEDRRRIDLPQASVDERTLVERRCRTALGDRAPADADIRPMLKLAAAHPLDRIADILAEESERRTRPVRTWSLWAQIVAERLTAEAQAESEQFEWRKSYPDDRWRDFMAAFVDTGEWHQASQGYPPGHGLCCVPAHILAEFKRQSLDETQGEPRAVRSP